MLTMLLWVAGPVLEVLVLLRAIHGKFLGKYRLFYFYVAWVLVCDGFRLAVFRYWPQAYSNTYWYSQLFSVLVGGAVVWEIYRLALANYPGAARMARSVLLFVFLITVTRIAVYAINQGHWAPGQTTLETEKEFRVVQFALLTVLMLLLAHYEIPTGKNLKGIVLGYSVFVITSLVQLTLRNNLGESFQAVWQFIQPATYLVVLSVWCVALWRFEPTPNSPECRVEEDYHSLVGTTRRRLRDIRSHLTRSVRP
jgi:hypothetical protein